MKTIWTNTMLNYLTTHYADESAQSIADTLGITISAVWGKAQKLGLHKSKEFMFHCADRIKNSEAAVRNRFQKGTVPPNKGKKWSEFMTKECMENSRKTTFKKGVIPPNQVKVGTQRVMTDGSLMVKIADPNVWKNVSEVVWENAGRTIPEGYMLRHINGDNKDNRLENLVLIDKIENMVRNSIHSKGYDEGIIELDIIKARINNKLRSK